MTYLNEYQEAAKIMIGDCAEVMHVLDGFLFLVVVFAILSGFILGTYGQGFFDRLSLVVLRAVRKRVQNQTKQG